METPGQRFIRLHKLDIERSLKGARMQVSLITRQLELYKYTPEDVETYTKELDFYKREAELFNRELELMGGAENGSNKSTFVESANETPQFKEMSCITV